MSFICGTASGENLQKYGAHLSRSYKIKFNIFIITINKFLNTQGLENSRSF